MSSREVSGMAAGLALPASPSGGAISASSAQQLPPVQVGHARGDDFLLAQRQNPALVVRDAAAAEIVIDHPQLDVVEVAGSWYSP
jgi:hypothetical protein